MSFTSSNSFIRFNAAQAPNATVSTGTPPTGTFTNPTDSIFNIYIFTTNGTLTFSRTGKVKYVLVGGGGGGSGGCTFNENGYYFNGFGSGGGGGQVLQGSVTVANLSTITITVGNGGIGTVPDTSIFYDINKAIDGSNSIISGTFGTLPSNGGSGGTSLEGGASGGGYAGGLAAFDISGGGGGGASDERPGYDAPLNVFTRPGGNGSDGTTITINSFSSIYGGGGGGGGGYIPSSNSYGTSNGGTGGGGAFFASSAGSGVTNTGGGGAGGKKNTGTADGGSGIVIIYWNK